jgi:hypothetical protein
MYMCIKKYMYIYPRGYAENINLMKFKILFERPKIINLFLSIQSQYVTV